MKGMMDLPSLDVFIASLSAPLNSNQRWVGWSVWGQLGDPWSLKNGLSRAAPNASFSPEIQKLRTRLPIIPFLECHFAGSATKVSGCPAFGNSPGGSWAREERWVKGCFAAVSGLLLPHMDVLALPVQEAVSPIFTALPTASISCYPHQCLFVFFVFSVLSLIIPFSQLTRLSLPAPTTFHTCHSPLSLSYFCLGYLDCRFPGVLTLWGY